MVSSNLSDQYQIHNTSQILILGGYHKIFAYLSLFWSISKSYHIDTRVSRFLHVDLNDIEHKKLFLNTHTLPVSKKKEKTSIYSTKWYQN